MASRLTPKIISEIKLARARGYKYEQIAAYYVINQGRIADTVYGRIGAGVPSAIELPADFPPKAA